MVNNCERLLKPRGREKTAQASKRLEVDPFDGRKIRAIIQLLFHKQLSLCKKSVVMQSWAVFPTTPMASNPFHSLAVYKEHRMWQPGRISMLTLVNTCINPEASLAQHLQMMQISQNFCQAEIQLLETDITQKKTAETILKLLEITAFQKLPPAL